MHQQPASPAQQRPNPVSLAEVGARVCDPDKHRNVYCPRANECVTVALDKGWDGFACTKCPLYSQASGPSVADFLVRSYNPDSSLPSPR